MADDEADILAEKQGQNLSLSPPVPINADLLFTYKDNRKM